MHRVSYSLPSLVNFATNSHVVCLSHTPAIMAVFIPYDNQRGSDKFVRFVMAGVCFDSAEYSRRLQNGEDVSDLQKIAHSLLDASSAAVKSRNDHVAAKAFFDARKRQENEDFEQVVGLRNGRSVSANVDDLLAPPDVDDDGVDVDGSDFDGLNGGGLLLDGSGGLSFSKENARHPNASSLGAQSTARGNIAIRVESRVLLEQRLAKSAAKDPDGDRWFGPGEKPKKARHQDAQERMDDQMEGMVGEGSLMRQAIKDLTSGRAADNPTMMKEKEFGIISENMKKLLDVKAKLVALNREPYAERLHNHHRDLTLAD